MSRRKYAVIFATFAAALMIMLLLPFILFEIRDYSILNRTKVENIASMSDDFFNMEPLDTEERMALLCKNLADNNGDIVVIDNTGAYSDAQSERIFYNIRDEIANMQEIGAFPDMDMMGFDMVMFNVSTYVDISDTRRYVKIAHVAGHKGKAAFDAAMDLETNKIYFYSANHPNTSQKIDGDSLIEGFSAYLEMDFHAPDYDDSNQARETDDNVDAQIIMPSERMWLLTSDNGAGLMCWHYKESNSFAIRLYSE